MLSWKLMDAFFLQNIFHFFFPFSRYFIIWNVLYIVFRGNLNSRLHQNILELIILIVLWDFSMILAVKLLFMDLKSFCLNDFFFFILNIYGDYLHDIQGLGPRFKNRQSNCPRLGSESFFLHLHVRSSGIR